MSKFMKMSIAFIACLLVLSPVISAKNRPTMPDIQGRSIKGEKISLDDLRGNVVVVSFWATWCAPCKQELKVLNEQLENKKNMGLRILAISVDAPETSADIRGIVNRYKWKMPVMHDKDGSISAIHNPRGSVPFTIYVDRNGRMYMTHSGYTQGDRGKIEKRIDYLLGEEFNEAR